MSSAPTAMRMVSGRKRNSSTVEGKKSAGMPSLAGSEVRRGRRQGHVEAHVHPGLFEGGGIRARDRRQEAGGVDAHPDHHGDERHESRPLAAVEIVHVRSHLAGSVAIEQTLV